MRGLLDRINQLFTKSDEHESRIITIETALNINPDSEIEIIKRQIAEINKVLFDSKYDNSGKTKGNLNGELPK